MARYLYGASVQGIQEFIFKTNKLKEIVGASEIVKAIASKADEGEKKDPISFEDNFKADEVLLNAAGNIKAIFNSKEECQKAVLEFPKMVMQHAYGIAISQAVVKIEEEFTHKDIETLEKRLKIQRNRPNLPLDSSIGIIKLAPSTARASVEDIKEDENEIAIDKSTAQKHKAYKKFLEDNPDIEKFKDISTFSNAKNKIAIIHADGNGLGQIVPKLGNKLSSFSIKLNKATQAAFEAAKDENMSIRDVILGGDDMTVICNANDALEFTKRFLESFEKETAKIEELQAIGVKNLTACAGIAYCNEKYPFHYAINLAETLCSVTKKHAKNLDAKKAPSALMFHNIQSSNFQSWEKFLKNELTIKNDKEEIRLDFGPYYLSQPNQPHIDKLQNSIEAYRCEGSPISRLRNWLGELAKSQKYAQSLLERINEVTEQSGKWRCEIMQKNLQNLYADLSNEKLIVSKDGYNKTPIYDILQILSVTEAKR